MVSQAKPTGRPPEYVRDRNGRPVVGLSRNKSDGRYYITHSKPRKWLGTDFDVALVRFREWEAKQEGRTVRIPDSSLRPMSTDEAKAAKSAVLREARRRGLDVVPDDDAYGDFLSVDSEGNKTPALVRHHWIIPEDALWSFVGNLIRQNPHVAAEKTGLPLDRLHQFKPLQPSPTLQSLIDLFVDKAKITEDWSRKAKQFWAEFQDAVKVKTVRELTQEVIADYHDRILEGGYSPTYIRHRFGAVKRVFSFARQRGVAPTEMRTVLDYCAILQAPKKNGNDPHPISVKDFHALLKVADEKWQGILIAALNFCMYGIEISRVKKSEIDWVKKTLVTDREKTGCTRVAVLWGRTVEALKKCDNPSEYLFVTREGTPYDAEGLRTAFRKLRDKAGVADTVKFSDIRDGAYSAAIEEGADLLHAKLLAGHQTGISDAYVKRNPKMVADACRAIERKYFGGKVS